MTEWKSAVTYSALSQSSIAAPHWRIFYQTGGEGEYQTADCVGVGWLQNFRSHNFAKFLFSSFVKFSSNFAKFKIILSKFSKTPNFDKIIFNFAKFEENFTKHETCLPIILFFILKSLILSLSVFWVCISAVSFHSMYSYLSILFYQIL